MALAHSQHQVVGRFSRRHAVLFTRYGVQAAAVETVLIIIYVTLLMSMLCHTFYIIYRYSSMVASYTAVV